MTEDEKKQYLLDFGRRVKYYREKLGMSQRELGRRAGYVDGKNPATSISQIENGLRDTSQTKVAEIAEALGVEPYDLIVSPQVSRMIKYAELIQKEIRMWIYKGMVQERVKMPETGLVKVLSVKIKGNGLKAEQEAFKRLADRIAKLSVKRLLLSEAVGLYLKDIEKNLKPSSVRKARISLDSIIKVTSDAYLENITAGYIRKKFIASGKPNRTLNGYLKIFKTFWLWCYRNDLVQTREVFDKLTPFQDTPKKERIQDKFLETDEITALLSAMTEKRWILVTRFLLLSGLRIGELVALDNVDVWGKYIRVSKTYDANNKVVTDAKTFDSKRDVFIQAELRQVIEEIREYTEWQADVFGYSSDIFFPDVDGDRLKYYAFRKYLEETSERVLHRRVTPHTLRHTHCSMLASAGYPLEEISARLGHSDSRITKEIYLHRMKETKERANRQLDAIHMIG